MNETKKEGDTNNKIQILFEVQAWIEEREIKSLLLHYYINSIVWNSSERNKQFDQKTI